MRIQAVVIWVVMPCGVRVGTQGWGGPGCNNLLGGVVGGRVYLPHVGILHHYTASQPRRLPLNHNPARFIMMMMMMMMMIMMIFV
jgi:hypothetical protein